MKNKILFSLCLTLLLVNSCKKEEVKSDSISGHVYEEGSGNPIPNATVFLIAEGSGSWAPMKQMASTKTDQNGAFAIENRQDPDLSFHYLVAQASDYYILESHLDKEKYEVTDKTTQKNVYLFRKATIKVRLLNGGAGNNITLQGRRDNIHWTRNLIKDTTLDFNVEAYAPTKIHYTAVTASIAKSGDTTLITTPINSDTAVFRY
ncbi:MAG TPA: hypothetical protein DIW47_09135 [Bacteroidetes bacterium]|nr:hypothetical protein [Bacteroidota bacterium]